MTEPIRILTSLITLFALTGVQAQNVAPVPRLVVTIVIDQLRADYLDAFSSLYTDGGFARLMKDGRVYGAAEYPVADVDRASAMATLFTGTVPYDHGIIGDKWLDRATLRPVFCVDDPAFGGLNTAEQSSPRFLGVSTIGDELKVATEGKSLVYAISPFREAAILSAGHAADGAYWINDLTGAWCGTSYYGQLPAWLTLYNKTHALSARIDKLAYQPCSPAVGTFNYFVSGGMREPFKHRFTGTGKYRLFKSSALVNEEVNELATTCINSTSLGIDNVPDMLSLCYYAGNYNNAPTSSGTMEIQDTYVRLDKCIKTLLESIETKVGLKNTLIVMTSSGYEKSAKADLSKYRIPNGNFYINRTTSLLNMYFMAVYGQGRYVDAVFGNQVYLNHKLIEQKQLNMVDVMERAQEFLIQCEGVKDVYTSQRLTLGAWTPGISRIRNGYNPKCSGDLFIEVAPGWNLVNEDNGDNRFMRASYVPFPLVFFGNDIVAEKIVVPTSVDVIVPTLAHCMRIRAPNACHIAPLNDICH